MGPADEMQLIRGILADALAYYEIQELYVFQYLFKCSDRNILQQLPSISFLFGDYWFEVKPEHYVFQATDTFCTFCLYEHSYSYWKFGTSFLKDWYVTHSVKNEQFGFAPHRNSWRTAPELATETPTRQLSEYAGEL